MRTALCVIMFAVSVLPVAAATALPSCNRKIMTRHGNQVTIRLKELADLFNQKLSAAHSSFSNLRLTAEGGNKLTVAGLKNGKPISITGPLQAVDSGAIRLHADHIVRDGSDEMFLMNLFGRSLADYAHFDQTQSLSANENNLYIHPDPLLNLSGGVTEVSLGRESLTLTFASQPCQ